MKNPGTPYRLEMRADSLSSNEEVSHLSTSTSRGVFPKEFVCERDPVFYASSEMDPEMPWLWVMSLLFNTVSRFVIAFLPRSNHLLMAWLRPPSSVILEPKRKSVATFPPFICHGNEYVFCYPNVMDRRALNIHLHNKLLATGLVSTKIPQSTIC